MHSVVKVPKVMLPIPGIDLTKWAVIACDQFTSEPYYWETLNSYVDSVPSTYHLIFPEVFLERNKEIEINRVNQTMNRYIRNHLFVEEECLILVDRTTPFHEHRLGLILMLDLETYEYQEQKQGRVVATEKTVAERIPPRVEIRKNAPIEIPHVLVLMDDFDSKIIENIYKEKEKLQVLYDFDLNMGGGHLKGFKICEYKEVIDKINSGCKDDEILMIVGDGNHSLAAAKVHWENVKSKLTKEEILNHPARYALIEVESIYDDGLAFEPIHRVIFDASNDFLDQLQTISQGDSVIQILKGVKTYTLNIPSNPFEAVKLIQDFLDEYLKNNIKSTIDFVHGNESLKSVVKKAEGSIGITMPPLLRSEMFPYIKKNGLLPRKSFSLGEAVEKRYYLESRMIIEGGVK